MPVGTSVVAIRSLALAFSLGFEFVCTKGKKCCRSFPDALQIVLQKFSTHRSIFVEQGIVPLFDFFSKGLQALIGLLVRCFSSLHTPIVRSCAFACGYHDVRSVNGDAAKDCRCAVRFGLVLIDIE